MSEFRENSVQHFTSMMARIFVSSGIVNLVGASKALGHVYLMNLIPSSDVLSRYFKETYADALEKIFRTDKKFRDALSAMAFCEFLGPNSFAGRHKEDDPKELVLIDMNLYKKGFISATDFMDIFGHLKIAEMIYRGPLTSEFETQVRTGIIPHLNEGVVCKGGEGHDRWTCKIKTDAYRERLKQTYADKWQEFWE